MKSRRFFTTFLINVLLMIAAILSLFPLISLLISSFRPSTELMRHGISFNIDWKLMSLDNYIYIFTEASQYWKWYGNSLIITFLTIILSLFFSSMVGYALAIYNFKGRNLLFIFVLLIIMIPFEVMMLPLYQLMINLKLINTYLGVLLPSIVSAFSVFFFRQFALGLPAELIDAARIDGCSEYGIFFRIMAPLMLPAFSAMAIFQGLSSWNNFLWPLIVIRSNDLFTLPIGLATLLTPYGNNYDILISGSIMTILPVMILYIAFQKYFIAGLTAGSVKG